LSLATAEAVATENDSSATPEPVDGAGLGFVRRTQRREARFLRVVGHYRTFLLAIERLDRGVDVENPRRVE
jgi:hypothetical protein